MYAFAFRVLVDRMAGSACCKYLAKCFSNALPLDTPLESLDPFPSSLVAYVHVVNKTLLELCHRMRVVQALTILQD